MLWVLKFRTNRKILSAFTESFNSKCESPLSNSASILISFMLCFSAIYYHIVSRTSEKEFSFLCYVEYRNGKCLFFYPSLCIMFMNFRFCPIQNVSGKKTVMQLLIYSLLLNWEYCNVVIQKTILTCRFLCTFTGRATFNDGKIFFWCFFRTEFYSSC